MTTFVDTSAIFALLDRDDDNHAAAAAWLEGARCAEALVTHDYVVVESSALVHRRLGRAATGALFDALMPVIDVTFVGEPMYSSALREWLAFGSRRSSLVDWVSFQMIRAQAIGQAFAFDGDFGAQGIVTVP